jgi:thioester reductase-like protein
MATFAKTQLKGLQNLLRAALASNANPKFVFCSSIASILGGHTQVPAQEKPSEDSSDCGSLGYAQSKWVAEQMCQSAAAAGLNVTVARIGQLCGDTKHGVWNESEGWPLLFKTAQTTGCLPSLEEVRRGSLRDPG